MKKKKKKLDKKKMSHRRHAREKTIIQYIIDRKTTESNSRW